MAKKKVHRYVEEFRIEAVGQSGRRTTDLEGDL